MYPLRQHPPLPRASPPLRPKALHPVHLPHPSRRSRWCFQRPSLSLSMVPVAVRLAGWLGSVRSAAFSLVSAASEHWPHLDGPSQRRTPRKISRVAQGRARVGDVEVQRRVTDGKTVGTWPGLVPARSTAPRLTRTGRPARDDLYFPAVMCRGGRRIRRHLLLVVDSRAAVDLARAGVAGPYGVGLGSAALVEVAAEPVPRPALATTQEVAEGRNEAAPARRQPSAPGPSGR